MEHNPHNLKAMHKIRVIYGGYVTNNVNKSRESRWKLANYSRSGYGDRVPVIKLQTYQRLEIKDQTTMIIKLASPG